MGRIHSGRKDCDSAVFQSISNFKRQKGGGIWGLRRQKPYSIQGPTVVQEDIGGTTDTNEIIISGLVNKGTPVGTARAPSLDR
ncbi:hypothetical protein L2E82_28659 [Cichorium intybus]|uniref:Uncharacterized protein n=1 Tax=Cichorium intybus TaxID=13427 RepID=A0ACB9CWC4_CICIN|nr:hypothetical protein L2E82_28659 [Cichorium intybus]